MWILWMTSSLSSHSTSASVSELSRLVTHTAVSSPKCNSENRPLSNSVAFQTLFKWHRYCGILKIHIVRKINTGIRYEPVYRPALVRAIACTYVSLQHKSSHRSLGYICSNSQQYIEWVKIIHFSFMTKIIRILRSCSMKIFSTFPTINISTLNFWLVICIAKNFIWTTLKMIFSIFRFFCTLRFSNIILS